MSVREGLTDNVSVEYLSFFSARRKAAASVIVTVLFNTTLVHFNWRMSKDIANHQRAAPQMVQRNPKMLRRVQKQTGKQSPKFTDQEDTYQGSDFLKILNRVQSWFSVSGEVGRKHPWRKLLQQLQWISIPPLWAQLWVASTPGVSLVRYRCHFVINLGSQLLPQVRSDGPSSTTN